MVSLIAILDAIMKLASKFELLKWLRTTYYFRNLINFVARGGDYWRLLTAGEYEVTASIKNYQPLTQRVLVTNPMHQEAFVVNFHLKPAQELRNWVSRTPNFVTP